MCTTPPPSTMSRPDAAVGEVLGEPAHPDAPAAVHDRRDRPEPGAGVAHPRARGVDELLGVAHGEEVRLRVEVRALRHRDLHRRRRAPARGALLAAGPRAHEQPRVVRAHRDPADHDRVARGAHLVDPIEVGVVGQREARRAVAEVAVERDAAAQHGVRAVRHRRLRSSGGGSRDRRPGPRRRPPAADPRRHEHDGARQAGDERHHAVGDRGGDPGGRAQAGGGEGPRRHAFARPPAPDVGQRAGEQHQQREREQRGRRRGHAGGVRGDQEGGRVAGDDQRRRERDGGPRGAGEHPVAQLACDGAAPARPARRAAHAGATATSPAAAASSVSATSGIASCTGDGRTSSTATVRTACTTCPAVRSHATARSPRPTSRVSRPWLMPRWTSPTTPPGSVRLRKSER